jgi:hypothetical protein
MRHRLPDLLDPLRVQVNGADLHGERRVDLPEERQVLTTRWAALKVCVDVGPFLCHELVVVDEPILERGTRFHFVPPAAYSCASILRPR